MNAAPDKPLWRQAFDLADSRVSPLLEEATQTTAFVEGLRIVVGVDATVRAVAERWSRRLWHLANLPAGSDITRLRRQLAALDHEVRRLRAELETSRGGPDG